MNTKSHHFILKDSTALLFCYGLKRFAEDMFIDSINADIEKYIHTFCLENNYQMIKDTSTTKRYWINDSNMTKPLKIEVAYHQKNIASSNITKINGMMVYRINPLFNMKINAYNRHSTIRDLYDIVFILQHYFNEISKESIEYFKNILTYRGLEYFDYLIHTQKDPFIDNDQLTCDFLEIFNQLELIDNYELEKMANQNN